jgi:hypothetical protein
MRYIFGLLGFSLLSVGLIGQKYPNVTLGTSGATGLGLCEPSISINPVNSANMVAGAILDQVFYSQDSGKTWQQDTLKSTYGVWGDPVLISDYAGCHYFLHLSDPTGKNWQSEEILDRIVVQKSTNGGKSWSNGSYMGLNHPKDQDKHWAVADPGSGNLYVTWTQFDDYGSEEPTDHSNIMFSLSRDSGTTWSEAKSINQIPGNCLDGDSTTEGAVPAVGPDGQVYVAWSNQNKIFFDRSTNQGQTWLNKDKVVARHVGGWDTDVPGLKRSNGMPVTVCDISESKNRGTIYVNWVDDRNGHYDVWLAKSSDEGETWSVPLRINDDTTQADQFFSWLACDPLNGYLYCVFYDRRHNTNLQTDVFLAYSKDGGLTWTNEKISESSFTPTKEVFFGDYNHIGAYNGVVRPIWTRYEKGQLSIHTALINSKNLKN